jgi:hypothetical protein
MKMVVILLLLLVVVVVVVVVLLGIVVVLVVVVVVATAVTMVLTIMLDVQLCKLLTYALGFLPGNPIISFSLVLMLLLQHGIEIRC